MQVSIFGACPQWQGCGWKGIWRKNGRRGMTEMAAELVGWLEFNVPFQHKYGYIRDDGPLSGTQPDGRLPASVIFPCSIKVQKISSGTGSHG